VDPAPSSHMADDHGMDSDLRLYRRSAPLDACSDGRYWYRPALDALHQGDVWFGRRPELYPTVQGVLRRVLRDQQESAGGLGGQRLQRVRSESCQCISVSSKEGLMMLTCSHARSVKSPPPPSSPSWPSSRPSAVLALQPSHRVPPRPPPSPSSSSAGLISPSQARTNA